MTTLAELAPQIAACTRCNLAQGRLKAVPGEGPANARIMFIGEGPGYHENQQGRPFVGPAGQFLDELLGVAGLKRQECYITNVCKCRPPNNRDPLPDEIAVCSTWLDQQIALIDPAVIVTLGRYSMAKFFPGETISKIHGAARVVGGRLIVPMYHPAAALHQPRYRELIVADFRKLPAILMETARPPAAKPSEEPPKQLSLF